MTGNSLAAVVERLAARLTDATVPISFLVEQFGDVSRRYAGSGYYLAPRDERLASVWIGLRVGTGEAEEVADVKLDLKAERAELTLGDLQRLFGEWAATPPSRTVQHAVAFRPEPAPPDRPFTIALFAETDGAPTSESVAVRAVDLRRDRR